MIDTGIDYHHPDLGGCFGRGCRVEKGFDFVGDDFNANDAVLRQPTTPRPSPTLIQTTATVTARTSAASSAPTADSRVSRPGVTFHAYRVFGCEGSTTSDIMLAAMELALDDEPTW